MLHVVLLATHWTPSFQNAVSSLEANGFSYTVLGRGETWKGWKWRMSLYLKFCQEQVEDDEKILVFMDAYDILCNISITNFIHNFKMFHSSIVLSAEWWCGSSRNCGSTMKFKKSSPHSNINAGFICGYSKALQKMYSDILSSYPENEKDFDDQKAIANYVDEQNKHNQDVVNNNQLVISLDSNGVLCRTHNIFDSVFDIRKEQQQLSSFHHFPGPMLKIGLFPIYNTICNLLFQTHKVLFTPLHTNYETEVCAIVILMLLISITCLARSFFLKK